MPRKRSSLGRLTYDAQRKRRSRASQTIEERRAWNEVNRLRVANSRALETDEQREARKLGDRLRTSRLRVSKLTQQRRAYVLSKEIVPIENDLYPRFECGHCSSQKMNNEAGMCCANDKLKFPILHPPIEFKLLSCGLSSFSDDSVDSKNFLQDIFDSSFEMRTEGDEGFNDDYKPIIKSEFENELNEHSNISGFATGDEDNTWEPEDNLDCPDLISAYEEARLKREREVAAPPEVEEGHSTRKRAKRGDKKKKIEEIEKPRGLARGLQPEKILAGQLFHGTLHFLVKWRDCTEMDVVPGHDLGQSFPDFVINYYEQCAPFSVRHAVGRVPRIAPELPPLETSQINTETAMEVSQEDTSNVTQTDEAPVEMPQTEPQPPIAEPESQSIEVPVN